MNTRVLKYCIEIARYKSFTKVAEMNFISQQSLSQQIKSLEDYVGVQLFARNNRAVSITPAGEVFVAEAETALVHINAAVKKAQLLEQGYEGALWIGCNGPSSRKNLVKAIEQFKGAYPQVDIHIKNAPYSEIVDDFKNKNAFDLIVVGDFEQFNPEIFNVRPYKSGRVCAVVGLNHPLAKKKVVTQEELLAEQLICLSIADKDNTLPIRRMERFQRILGEIPSNIRFAEDSDTIDMLVEGTLGYTLLNSDLKGNYRNKQFVFIPIKGVKETHQTRIVWRKNNVNPCLPKFLGMVDEMSG